MKYTFYLLCLVLVCGICHAFAAVPDTYPCDSFRKKTTDTLRVVLADENGAKTLRISSCGQFSGKFFIKTGPEDPSYETLPVTEGHQDFLLSDLMNMSDRVTAWIVVQDVDGKELSRRPVLLIIDRSNGGRGRTIGNYEHTPKLGCCPSSASTRLEATGCIDNWCLSAHFGLELENFVRGRRIYTLDLRPVPHRYYLTTASFGRCGVATKLHTRPVNMNRQSFKPGQDVSIQAVHLNPLLQTIKIQDTVYKLDSEPPYLLRQLFFPDSGASLSILNRWNTLRIGSAGTVGTGSGNNLAPDEQTEQQRLDALQCFFNCYYALKATVIAAYNPCSDFPCCGGVQDRYATMMRLYDQVMSETALADDRLKEKQQEINQINTAQADFDKNRSDLEKAGTDLEKARNAETPDDATIKRLEKQIDALKSAYETLEPIVADSRDQYDGLVDDMLGLKSLINARAKLTALEPEIAGLAIFVNNLTRASQQFERPISVNGNMTEILISVQNRDTVNKLTGQASTPYFKRIEVPVLWQPMVSFGTGTFIGLSKSLQTQQYQWQEIADAGNTLGGQGNAVRYRLNPSGVSPRPAGFAALANLHLRAHRTLGFGASVGAGITLEATPRIGYLAGLSLFTGDLRQLGITMGGIAMRVDKLQPNYQNIVENGVLSTSSTASVGYYQRFEAGWFIAVSYTPFKPIKR